MNAGMVERVIEALSIFIRTLKEVTLQGVSWNTEEVMRALAQFIADAPKLEKCDIFDKTSHPRIVFDRKKASYSESVESSGNASEAASQVSEALWWFK